jgi:ubiquinone/menaquinone biosynthesis C-methylase UbiE
MLNKIIQPLLDIPGLFNTFRHFIDPGQFEMMQLAVKKYKVKSILDVGCGTGDFCNVTKGTYVGIDNTWSFIQYAKKKYPKKTFYYGDATNINWKKNYDGSLMICFMHHLKDKEVIKVLKSMKKATKKYIFILDNIPVDKPLTNFFYSLDRGAHIRSLTNQEKLIKKAGLKIKETMHFRTPFPKIYYHSLFVCKVK